MSKEIKQAVAESGTLPEGTVIEDWADYETIGPQIIDPDPNMYYFLAAKGQPDRPDSVETLRLRGYRVSEKKHTSPDCVLMELPIAVWNNRQAARDKKNRALMASLKRRNIPVGMGPDGEPVGLEKIADYQHGIKEQR